VRDGDVEHNRVRGAASIETLPVYETWPMNTATRDPVAGSNDPHTAGIRSAQVVVPCADLPATLDQLTQLGFVVDLVMPADAPTMAIVSGHEVTLRLEQTSGVDRGPPINLRLACGGDPPRAATTQDGAIRFEFVPANAAIEIPPLQPRFVLTRAAGEHSWHVGRAGMQYRDLIPGRLGGRFVASHIRIPSGGPVPDYVHYHRIRFQMIYCRTGSARLVYEDQGDPFVFSAGDCVLQPPEIRHRVLEASAGFEVIEVGCPAVHETYADRRLALPTGRTLPDRLYGSQHFVRHVAAEATWRPWHADTRESAFEARDTGISTATGGLAGVRVVRSKQQGAATQVLRHDGEFLLFFVLRGCLDLASVALGQHALADADACVIPAAADFRITARSDLELLEVALPGQS